MVKISQKQQWTRMVRAVCSIALPIAVFGSGCLSNNLSKLTTEALTSNGVTAASPDAGGSVDSFLVLSRVVKTTSSPNTNLDLIGDGSGFIGQYCTSDSGSSTGSSTCTCNYDYTKIDGSHESFDAPTIYREANMIRCSYSSVPTSIISELKVKIHLTSSDTYSNNVTFNFTGTGTTLDTSDEASFVKAARYQCRDALYVPYLLDSGKDGSGIYDPFLSESAALSYPLNFYTTNMGGTIATFINNPATVPVDGNGWLCPTLPEDTSEDDAVATDTTHFDLRIFSVGADNSGSKRIFPIAGDDRHTFYLAKRSSGLFKTPVNAFVAPSTYSSINPDVNAGISPPLGYGTPFVSTGSDTESCPDTQVTIPAGYQMMKLWLFRGSLEPRKVPTSTKINQLNYVGCNPGFYDGTATTVFANCDIPVGSGGFTLSSLDANGFASRVLYSGGAQQCVGIDPGAGVNLAFPNVNLPDGSDSWEEIVSTCPQSEAAKDPMGLCNASFVPTAPHDYEPDFRELDNGTSRWDAIFVVTPPTVTTYHMRNMTEEARPYIPYRFYSPATCDADVTDPDTETETCQSEDKVTYGLELRDITQAEGTPVDDPARSRAFPICVLQKI